MAGGVRRHRMMGRVRRAMLAFDAWLDTSLFQGGRSLRDGYDDYSAFMDRFSVAGWRRGLTGFASETLSLGLGGAIVALALAIPAFQDTSEDWLKKQDLAVTFLDRSGAEVGRRGILHDDSVPIDQMPPYLIQAILATEDRRFYEHFGIDLIGTLRAVTVNAKSSGVVQGGSSITQQLAKNLFLSNERTFERKIKEAYLALWLEHHLTKREILQTYLDRVYMGGGTFGIQAASEFYFGTSVRDVTLPEAAMLAGLFKAPTKYAPHINLPAARARAGDVLSNLVDAGYMTEGQVYPARRNPATPVDRTREVAPDWYLDYAYDDVRKLAEAGRLGNNRVLTVRTALDSDIQQHTETVIEDQLRENGPIYHAKQSAMVVMEPDGAVRAIVGGRDYGASQFNRATVAQRQPGSSFKPFVYLTALETGKFKPSTLVTDSPVCIGNWCVRNYEGESMGTLPLWAALAHSLNTVAVKLSIAIGDGSPKAGRAKIIENAHALGLTTPLTDTVVAARGRRRGDGDRHGDRLFGLRQRRQARHALRGGRYPRQPRQSRLSARPRCDAAETGRAGGRRPAAELHAGQGRHRRHGPGGAARQRHRGRQDRHHQQLPRCLVLRVHGQLRGSGLVRERRLSADEQDDGRDLAGRDMARRDGLRASRHRDQTGLRARQQSVAFDGQRVAGVGRDNARECAAHGPVGTLRLGARRHHGADRGSGRSARHGCGATARSEGGPEALDPGTRGR